MKTLLIKTVLLLIVATYSIPLSGQQRELTSSNRRARMAFEEGFDQYRLLHYNKAEEEFLKALSFDPDFIEANIIYGEMLYDLNRYEESIERLEKAISIDPEFYFPVHFMLGQAYFKSAKYKEAKDRFNIFIEYRQYTRTSLDRATHYLKSCEFAIEAMKSPVPFEPANLGSAINSEFAEYSPVLTADGQTLVFTRTKPRTDTRYLAHGDEFEDFYISHFVNGEWTKAKNLGPPINTPLNEAAQTLTADGRHLYFTGCGRPENVGSCDIFYSQQIGHQWSIPRNLGDIVNSGNWDSQPSISADGQTLYFTSGRRGSYGHMDIWVTTRDDEGNWTAPKNLGNVINTNGREMSPFIHSDNRTLYFASDGHPGMGGLDLFMSRKDENGEWMEPVNLGYPINTNADEMSIFISSMGDRAYFASDHLDGFGDMDIYSFELFEEIRPQPVTYMKGIVYNSETKERIEADIELIDLVNNETIIRTTSDKTFGDFLVVIPTEQNIGLNVSKTGYLFFSENFSYSAAREKVDPYMRDVFLQPIRTGETVILRNIFFETAKYDLLPESVAELERLLKLLNDNPDIKIEISGHTDSVGTYEYNLELSKNRARSVYNFLIERGIDESRLTYAGYAETMPIDSNETAEGRANNRRTEFKIIE